MHTNSSGHSFDFSRQQPFSRRRGRVRSRFPYLQGGHLSRFDCAQAVHDYFKNHYGPTIEAYANIGNNPVLVAELDAQLVELAQQYLVDGAMRWEYLLLTSEKR